MHTAPCHVLVLCHADAPGPRSAPILADSASSSISVATDLRKLCVVTPGTPRSSRTSIQRARKLSGSRQVPAVDGNTIDCSPR
jgi:hypothetical protein